MDFHKGNDLIRAFRDLIHGKVRTGRKAEDLSADLLRDGKTQAGMGLVGLAQVGRYRVMNDRLNPVVRQMLLKEVTLVVADHKEVPDRRRPFGDEWEGKPRAES